MWYVAWANGISMCLSVFAQLTVVTNTQTDVPLYITNYLAIVRICAGNAIPAKRQYLAHYVLFSRVYMITVPDAVGCTPAVNYVIDSRYNGVPGL